MAFLEISAWVEKRAYDCIIVDTAPSGHTLRLLAMPQFLRKWVAMLETLLAKHRYMKWTFARSRDRDDLDAFLDELAASVERMEAVLQDSARCSFVPVMLAEEMSLRETVSIVKEADRLKLPIDDIVINKLYPDSHCPVCREEHYLQACALGDLFLKTFLTRFALWGVPLHAEEVRGQVALESFWEEARQIREPPPAEPEPRLSPDIKVKASIPSPPPRNYPPDLRGQRRGGKDHVGVCYRPASGEGSTGQGRCFWFPPGRLTRCPAVWTCRSTRSRNTCSRASPPSRSIPRRNSAH